MVDLTPKLPKHPWDDKEIEPIYGRTFGWKGPNGEAEIRYSDVEAPDKFSWQKMEATGSFSAMSADSSEKQNNTELNVGNKFSYVADGDSSQVDGHRDTNTMSTERRNCMGDIGESGKKNMVVFTEGKVEAIDGGHVRIVSADSSSWSGTGTYGDQVNEHSGNWHAAFEKDHVQAIKKNKITMIEEGDYAIHTQTGNFDLQVSSGKLHLMTSADDLIANSNVKVLLQVGSQSKVTVEPSKVMLQVGDSSYIEITAGGIKLVSPRIDLNP